MSFVWFEFGIMGDTLIFSSDMSVFLFDIGTAKKKSDKVVKRMRRWIKCERKVKKCPRFSEWYLLGAVLATTRCQLSGR